LDLAIVTGWQNNRARHVGGSLCTHRAVDMIPKIWRDLRLHYERPDKTAVYFNEGLKVITCPAAKPA
jgi:hypothetical protein